MRTLKGNCYFHKDRRAMATVSVQGGGTMLVCISCRDKIAGERISGTTCKFCGIPVKSSYDPTPMSGNHKNGCIRR